MFSEKQTTNTHKCYQNTKFKEDTFIKITNSAKTHVSIAKELYKIHFKK